MSDPIRDFVNAMAAEGLTPPREIIADGKIKRFKPVGDKSSTKHSWYSLHLDGLPAGSFGSWKTGETHKWCAKRENATTPQERAALEIRKAEDRKAREEEETLLRAEAENKAARMWAAAHEASSAHPYFKAKGIRPPPTIRQLRNMLLVPMRDIHSKLHSLQVINPDGSKTFLTGGRTAGCYATIGKPKSKIIIAEGMATAMSIHESTGEAVAIAFSAGNIMAIALGLRSKYPLELIIAADDDRNTLGNPGLTKATEAARAIGAKIAVPKFSPDDTISTDFNDMAHMLGHAEVCEAIDEAAAPLDLPPSQAGAASPPAAQDVPKQSDPEPLPRQTISGAAPEITRELPTYIDDADEGIKLLPINPGEFFDERGKALPYSMAAYVSNELHFTADDTGDFVYIEGKFEDVSDRRLDNVVAGLTGGRASPSDLDKFKRISRAVNFKKDFFDLPEPGLMNLANCVLDVKSGAFYDHDPKFRMRYKLAVEFDPEATAPRWLQFLEDTFGGDQDLISLVREIMAYTLLGGDPFLQRAFCFYGTGRNGKSTLLNVLKGLIGRENFSTVPLKLLDRPFSVVTMDGKIANICEETPNDSINSEFFKTAVGGGELQAAQKNKPEFSMPVRARFVFACNELPVFKDATKGMLERLVFVPFTRFIPDHQRDTKIDHKLRAEYPGIINDLVPIARALIESRTLSKPASVSATKETYKLESDSVYEWYRDTVEVYDDPEPVLDIDNLYDNYKIKSDKAGRSPLARNNFSKRVLAYVKDDMAELGLNPEFAGIYRIRSAGDRIRSFKYLRLQSQVSLFKH